jgi:hypothetical protein
MNTSNLIVFCLKCGEYRNSDETHYVKVENKGPVENKKRYICKGCYDALPQTQEINSMRLLYKVF